MSNNITVKGANYNYAPGLATYAADGIQGETGLNGNNIFYTNILIKTELLTILNQIKNNYYPLKNNKTLVNRPYQNNDLFFDNAGTIWQLINYDNLSNNIGAGVYVYSDYFKIVGQITLDLSKYIDRIDLTGRIILDPSNYSGFDIVLGDLDPATVINEEMPINVASNIIDENNNISFLIFLAILTGIQENGNMLIYFDTNTKSFHVNTKNTLFVDTDVLIANSSNELEYDNYSRILTDSDSISSFKNLCDKFVYEINMDTSSNYYVEISVKDDTLSNNEKVNLLEKLVTKDNVYIKIYDNSINQYVIFLDNNIAKYNTNYPTIPFDASTFTVTALDVSILDPRKCSTTDPWLMRVFRKDEIDSSYVVLSDSASFGLDTFNIADIDINVGLYKSVPSLSNGFDPVYWSWKPVCIRSDYAEKTWNKLRHYEYEFEITNNMIDTIRDVYLCISTSYNYANITTDLVTMPLLNVKNKLKTGKKYKLCYSAIKKVNNSTTPGEPKYHILNLNVELLLEVDDSVTVKLPIDVYNPVISTLIPGDINNIAKLSLLYNTEVFLLPK